LLFAARPDLLTRVLGVVTRGLSRSVVKRAVLAGSAGGQTGVVTFIQRFGSALNLNIHLHMLIPEGAYTFTGYKPRFHRASTPTNAELAHLLDTLIRVAVNPRLVAYDLIEAGEEDDQ